MKNLLEQAANFLKENPEFNEVELRDGGTVVRLIRYSPAPITNTGWVDYPPVWKKGSQWIPDHD